MVTEADHKIDHDRLLKELFHTFFVEFVELFFPQVAALMDKRREEVQAPKRFTIWGCREVK